jgi:hypothetical protein
MHARHIHTTPATTATILTIIITTTITITITITILTTTIPTEQLPFPVFVLGGDQDKLIPPSTLAHTAAVYGTDWCAVPNTAHALMSEAGGDWKAVAEKLLHAIKGMPAFSRRSETGHMDCSRGEEGGEVGVGESGERERREGGGRYFEA